MKMDTLVYHAATAAVSIALSLMLGSTQSSTPSRSTGICVATTMNYGQNVVTDVTTPGYSNGVLVCQDGIFVSLDPKTT